MHDNTRLSMVLHPCPLNNNFSCILFGWWRQGYPSALQNAGVSGWGLQGHTGRHRLASAPASQPGVFLFKAWVCGLWHWTGGLQGQGYRVKVTCLEGVEFRYFPKEIRYDVASLKFDTPCHSITKSINSQPIFPSINWQNKPIKKMVKLHNPGF